MNLLRHCLADAAPSFRFRFLPRARVQLLAEEARHSGRTASVLRRGELDLRPGQSAEELLGRLMETAGADDLLQHFREQIRAGKLGL
jgi:hypothetical protein